MNQERRVRRGRCLARLWGVELAAAGILVTAPALAQPAPAAPPPQQTWQQLPKMLLERQFAGPLQDTLIQRWRDPVDGMICYIYLPITAQHSAPTASGYVQYGPNTIGSISCSLAPAPAPRAAAPAAAIARAKTAGARPTVPRARPPSPPKAAATQTPAPAAAAEAQ